MEDEIRYKRTFSPRLFYFDDWEADERQAKVASVYKQEPKCWKPWQRDCRGFKAHICSFQGTLINFSWHEEILTDSISEEGEDQKQSTIWVCLWYHTQFQKERGLCLSLVSIFLNSWTCQSQHILMSTFHCTDLPKHNRMLNMCLGVSKNLNVFQRWDIP